MAKAKMTAKEKKDNKELFEAIRFMEQEEGVPGKEMFLVTARK